ncbi:heat shock factor-type, DNA-binding protein [Tanacetum coccineum]
MDKLAEDIHTIAQLQLNKTKMKEKCDETRKELFKVSQKFERWCNKDIAKKLSSHEIDDMEVIAKQEIVVEALKLRMVVEEETYEKLFVEVKDTMVVNLTTRLPEVWDEEDRVVDFAYEVPIKTLVIDGNCRVEDQVTMKCLKWPAPLEVFLIQSTVSHRTNEENVTIKLTSVVFETLQAMNLNYHQVEVLLRKVRHTNVVQFIGACTKPSNLCIVTGNDDRVFTRYRRQIDHLILLVLLDKNWNFCMDNDFYWNFGMEALEVHSDLEILIISSVSYILCLQKYSDLEVLEVLIMYGSSVCFCISEGEANLSFPDTFCLSAKAVFLVVIEVVATSPLVVGQELPYVQDDLDMVPNDAFIDPDMVPSDIEVVATSPLAVGQEFPYVPPDDLDMVPNDAFIGPDMVLSDIENFLLNPDEEWNSNLLLEMDKYIAGLQLSYD